ncbi:MAG: hypothetical protein LBR79_01675 [Oscillospiraceae bacterium]|nr:hypothetical protein [Oscillospiraceae bacterium]
MLKFEFFSSAAAIFTFFPPLECGSKEEVSTVLRYDSRMCKKYFVKNIYKFRIGDIILKYRNFFLYFVLDRDAKKQKHIKTEKIIVFLERRNI